MDDFFDFEEHPENFYIADEMINGDDTTSTGSCCSVLLVIAILTIILTVA